MKMHIKRLRKNKISKLTFQPSLIEDHKLTPIEETRILIVDGDPSYRYDCKSILHNLGFHCIHEASLILIESTLLSPATGLNDFLGNWTGKSSSCGVGRVFTALIMATLNTTFEAPINTTVATILPYHSDTIHGDGKTSWELGGGSSCEAAPLSFGYDKFRGFFGF